MVYKLQLQYWSWIPALALLVGLSASGNESLNLARQYYKKGEYFKAARYSFDALDDRSVAPKAYAWITRSLVQARLYHSASYFFIRTLQTEKREPIRQALEFTEELVLHVGADLFRNFLIRHTQLDDYSGSARNAFFYIMGKESLLSGREKRAIQFLKGVQSRSVLKPYALQMQGTARAILGMNDLAVGDFRACERAAKRSIDRLENRIEGKEVGERWATNQIRELEDLQARCIAGNARTVYQTGDFDLADRTWDEIPKASFVYADILFEHAWNAFAQREYNRSLGKLVSYKSPALGFVFNSEIDVLRAQSYLALCHFGDANKVINEFHDRYSRVALRAKNFIRKNKGKLVPYFELGLRAVNDRLHTKNDLHRMVNRFARGRYFQSLASGKVEIEGEREAIRQFSQMHKGAAKSQRRGFPGFLRLVLLWREKSVTLLGGAFVRNSLLDYYNVLVSDFEKIAFIKLEMLKAAKEKLLYPNVTASRSRGNVVPKRRDDQYYWSFNGEFWNGEIGDYVFGLESQCET